MNNARLFDNKDILVSAEDVKSGKFDRHQEFITPEEEFKVTYVSKAKNNGKPFFRLYYSYNDYKKLSDYQKSKYDILRNMCHFAETKWHKDWETKFSEFGEKEKYIKNDEIKKYKRADIFIENLQTCIEFQHSYLDNDFDSRNEFYNKLGYKTIWLFDMTKSAVEKNGDYYETLEDNAKGFFKVAQVDENLKSNYVYIQAKNNKIYRVGQVYRKEIDDIFESTIRFFYTNEIYTEEEFIKAVISNKLKQVPVTRESLDLAKINELYLQIQSVAKTLYELWDDSYEAIIFKNIKQEHSKESIIIYRNVDGKGMQRDGYGSIIYRYVGLAEGEIGLNSDKRYRLSKNDANKKEWIVIEYLNAVSSMKNKNRYSRRKWHF